MPTVTDAFQFLNFFVEQRKKERKKERVVRFVHFRVTCLAFKTNAQNMLSLACLVWGLLICVKLKKTFPFQENVEQFCSQIQVFVEQIIFISFEAGSD